MEAHGSCVHAAFTPLEEPLQKMVDLAMVRKTFELPNKQRVSPEVAQARLDANALCAKYARKNSIEVTVVACMVDGSHNVLAAQFHCGDPTRTAILNARYFSDIPAGDIEAVGGMPGVVISGAQLPALA